MISLGTMGGPNLIRCASSTRVLFYRDCNHCIRGSYIIPKARRRHFFPRSPTCAGQSNVSYHDYFCQISFFFLQTNVIKILS